MAKRAPKEKHTRRVVIVVVEGQSDENVLTVPLTEAFENKYGEDTKVFFAQIKNDDGSKGGDITSRNGAIPEKMHMLMNKLIIMPCIMDNNLMPKYVSEIVQIIDTDGVYIPDSSIVKSDALPDEESVRYDVDTISARNPNNIIERNDRKRRNIAELLRYKTKGFDIQNFYDTGLGNKATTKTVNVPYSLYYFSCNLDHFTCHNANLDRFQKIRKADEFARQYANGLESFKEFLTTDPDAKKNMAYEDSWIAIQFGTESLHRSTNLHLLLD